MRDAGNGRCRTGGSRKVGMQERQMLNLWDAGLKGCRTGLTGGMLEERNKGKEGWRRGRMRDRIDAG